MSEDKDKDPRRHLTPAQLQEPTKVITVRLPRSEYERVKEAAHLSYMSMNYFACDAVVGAADAAIDEAKKKAQGDQPRPAA